MRILSVEIGIAPEAGGGSERTYHVNRELLELGADVRMLITDRWMHGGRMPAGYPFPENRLIVTPSLNHRFNVPLPNLRSVNGEVKWADIIHLSGHEWHGALLAGLLARSHRKKVVITTRGAIPPRGRSMVLKRICHLVAGKRMLREASALVAVTDGEAAMIRPYGGAKTIIAVIPNGVSDPSTSITEDDFRSHFGLGQNPYFLFIGSLHPTKGADLLIEAFARFRTVQSWALVIAGAGYEEEQLRRAAARHNGPSEIVFAGQLDPSWRTAAIRGASFVVIPSRLDAMTMVVLEAAIQARPVLISRACGFDEVERRGGGLCVEPQADAILEGLRAMVDRRLEWPAMGERMLELAREYTWKRAAIGHLQLFERIVR